MEKNVVNEAILDGYIQNKKTKKIGYLPIIIIHIILFIFLLFTASKLTEPSYAEKLNNMATNIQIYENLKFNEQANVILSNVEYIEVYSIGFMFMISFLLWFWSFIFGILYITSSFINNKKIKRTKLGNIIIEKINGMKNFIHDFSNLKDADKKQLILWDDFLIYAVVLEENDIILDEILKYYNIKLI